MVAAEYIQQARALNLQRGGHRQSPVAPPRHNTQHRAGEHRHSDRHMRAFQHPEADCRFGGAHERHRGVERVPAEDSGDAVHHNIADNPAANRRCHPQPDGWEPVQSQGKGFDGAGSRPTAHAQKVYDHKGAGGPV